MNPIPRIVRFLYTQIIKPIFFRQDPEIVHNRISQIAKHLGEYRLARSLIRSAFAYQNPILHQNLWGIQFDNPVGLSAGFDKDAVIYSIMPSIGFGFSEIGTITFRSYEGNPKPRLHRLPQSKGLVVYYGLKNLGAPAIAAILEATPRSIPQIISIGQTNSQETVDREAGIADYTNNLKIFIDKRIGDAYEINISCPNTFGGEPFNTPEDLRNLLKKIYFLPIQKPVFIKMPINLPWEEFKKLIDVALEFKVQALTIGNLNKNRIDDSIKDFIPPHIKGGISGRPTWNLSNDLISKTYIYAGNKIKIIGVGGIFSAEDAYEKIKLGASLVELITGMIFEGPQLIGDINRGLVKLLKQDGYKNISAAIGAAHR